VSGGFSSGSSLIRAVATGIVAAASSAEMESGGEDKRSRGGDVVVAPGLGRFVRITGGGGETGDTEAADGGKVLGDPTDVFRTDLHVETPARLRVRSDGTGLAAVGLATGGTDAVYGGAITRNGSHHGLTTTVGRETGLCQEKAGADAP
jgi:hypothetical protein